MSESGRHITSASISEARRLKDATDYKRLDSMTDDDITKAVASDPDAPPLDVGWTQARLVIPPGKDVVTLRLDRDVLDWFRAHGKGYQTRINQVLRAFYEAHTPRELGAKPMKVKIRSHLRSKHRPTIKTAAKPKKHGTPKPAAKRHPRKRA
jgi:uncharacterized protein (DUF4415 family)